MLGQGRLRMARVREALQGELGLYRGPIPVWGSAQGARQQSVRVGVVLSPLLVLWWVALCASMSRCVLGGQQWCTRSNPRSHCMRRAHVGGMRPAPTRGGMHVCL